MGSRVCTSRMKHFMISTAASLLLLSVCAAQARVAESGPRSYPDTLPDLEFMIAARDASLSSILIPYLSTFEGPARCQYREEGWWALDKELRAAASLSGCEGSRPSIKWVVWQGSRSLAAEGRGSWEGYSNLLPPKRESFDSLSISRQRYPLLLSEPGSPGAFGLMRANTRWSEYLKWAHDARFMGTEDVGEFHCGKVMFDMDGTSDDGRYAAPWIVYFDYHSLIAVRIEGFIPIAQARHDLSKMAVKGDPVAVELAGEAWALIELAQVDTVGEVGPGIFVPTRATITWGLKPADTVITVQVEASQVSVNVPIDNRFFDVQASPQAIVADETLLSDPVQARIQRENYRQNQAFSTIVSEATASALGTPKPARSYSEPFVDSFTAPSLLFLISCADGAESSLQDIDSEFSYEERSAKRSTMKSLMAAAERLGYKCAYVKTPFEALKTYPGWCISVTTSSHQAPDSWTLWRIEGELVRAIQYPWVASVVSLGAFEKAYKGEALLLSKHPIPEVYLGARRTLTVAGIAILSVAGLILAIRAKKLRSTTT